MKKKIATLLLSAAFAATTAALAVSPVSSKLKVDAGTLQMFELFSPQLNENFTIEVWLPATYSPQTKHPVIYMHDGQMLFDAASTWNHQAWEVDSVVTALIKRGDIPTPIIVGPYNIPEQRISIYMPTEPVEMIASSQAIAEINQWMPQGARGADYVDFLADTLKPVVDSLYSTDPSMEATHVMGSSMGGLISLYALARRPEVFGGAACLSTHLTGKVGENETFPSALMGYLVSRIPTDGKHKIYFDNGDQDIDIPYMPYFPRVVELFREAGYDDAHLMKYFAPGRGHNERAWAERLHLPLTFLLQPAAAK